LALSLTQALSGSRAKPLLMSLCAPHESSHKKG
jgi:hypothetical protein